MMENKMNYNNLTADQEDALMYLDRVWFLIDMIHNNNIDEVVNKGTGVQDLVTAFSLLMDAASNSKEKLAEVFPEYKHYLENRTKSNGRP